MACSFNLIIFYTALIIQTGDIHSGIRKGFFQNFRLIHRKINTLNGAYVLVAVRRYTEDLKDKYCIRPE